MAYLSNVPQARRELFSLMKEGKLCAIEWEMDGLENTAQTFEEMYGEKTYRPSSRFLMNKSHHREFRNFLF